MAGKKGRSGGPRPNSGGARKGAGRPRKPEQPPEVPSPDGVERTPLEFLAAVQQGVLDPTEKQMKAAIAALPYVHQRKGEGGKKENDKEAASKIASGGKYAPASSPRLN